MTMKFYFTDKIKKLLIMTPLNAAIVCGVVWVVNRFGEYFYIYSFGFVSIIVIVMMYIYPEFIAPLFDTYSPLKEGELKSKV
jgi:STE24 endopeptidase